MSASLVRDHVLRISDIILIHSSGVDFYYLTHLTPRVVILYLRNLTLVLGVKDFLGASLGLQRRYEPRNERL